MDRIKHLLTVAFLIAGGMCSAHVVTYPAPPDRYLSTDYEITVDGKEVPVYRAYTQHFDKKYSFVYFDIKGPVTVTVHSAFPLDHLVLLPDTAGINADIDGKTATFVVDRPLDFSFEPDGRNSPLLLFINPLESAIPDPNDPQVVWFGPGEHNPENGLIHLTEGQTLYLAGGAVVNAGIEASGKNIRICGRGILDGSDWEHNAGPTDFMVNAMGCDNFIMQDIIIKGSYYWTIVPRDSDRVLIDHVRLAGSRVGNDDGVDPCNCSNVTIRRCFFRTDDDSVSPKGITRAGGEKTSRPVENILVEDCVFWVDFANVFRINTESSCPITRNIAVRDIDVIHFPDRDRVQIFWLHPTGEMPMENLSFERVRIHGEYPFNLIKITPSLQLVGTRPIEKPRPNNVRYGPGRRGTGSCGYGEFVVVPSYGPYVHNVSFRDIVTYGDSPRKEERGNIVIQGIDDVHDVANVRLENVFYYGKKMDEIVPLP